MVGRQGQFNIADRHRGFEKPALFGDHLGMEIGQRFAQGTRFGEILLGQFRIILVIDLDVLIVVRIKDPLLRHSGVPLACSLVSG